MFSSCFGRERPEDREPLLPQHRNHVAPDVVTGHQKNLDKKLHTYLLIRALLRGYMPSNEQAIILLRKLLASDVLAPDNQNLSYDGRKFVTLNRRLVKQLIDLLQAKNSGDELQNFLWAARKARLHVDLEGIGSAVTDIRTVNYKAAYSSLSTISSLLLQNPDFNKLFSDAITVIRQALASGVSTAAKYTEQAAEQIEPPDTQLDSIGDSPQQDQPRVDEDTRKTVGKVENILEEGVKEATKDAKETFEEAITPERKAALKERVRQAVLSLRRETDYKSSVSTLSMILQNYLIAYSTVVQEAADELTDDMRPNKALISAGNLLWDFISSFGEKRQWDLLKEKSERLLDHKERDPGFERIVKLVVESLEKLLTDPDYLFEHEDDALVGLGEMKAKFQERTEHDSLKDDVDAVIQQIHRVLISVYNDKQIADIKKTGLEIADLALASQDKRNVNMALLSDLGNVLLPLALETIQYIPIPRVTLISPDIDVLLEAIIIEPGKTVNSSSFLPYRVGVVTTNEVDVFKGWRRTKTHLSSTARIKIEGITFKTEDVGYIMKVHRGWFVNFTDSGLASFRMDEKGIDIYLDLEFTRSSVDELVILRGVSVDLHKVDFTLRRSKFSLLAWLFKPLVKPLLRKILQESIRKGIENGLRGLNRELIYTRERLRATRIANPRDLTTFVRAVLARWTAPSDLPIEVGIDWRARRASGRAEAPFDGEYAPGSLVGLFESEGIGAGERVEEGDFGGWRNACFEI
ncbi:hypothetical protein ABW19_dt0210559 [Dactylella cylindrospora]|nr:hypothetical protein ABW19_dt0210559 [Dactylella cylindrospora]